ncbi:MAG: hypothetical protein JW940_02320 [Polyangiaceae bacterium]|nr:hypothetical protein [Polyangiaceae bacterium]
MPQYGNDNQWFGVEVVGDAVVVTAGGFWSSELCAELGPAVMLALRAKGRGTRLTFELADLRTLRDEGLAAFRALIVRALANGAPAVTVRVSSALTRLQMLRMARELGRREVRVE